MWVVTHSRTWKKAESLAAQIIGGRRVWQKFSAGDAESYRFVADAKKRRAYTQREMRADLEKLAANPETRDRVAVLVLIDTPGRGHRAGSPLVVMTASSFQRMCGVTVPCPRCSGTGIEPHAVGDFGVNDELHEATLSLCQTCGGRRAV